MRYLHSDIDTVERVEIIRDLRIGPSTCWSGINLLREGLDILRKSRWWRFSMPTKEGFLRSERSLIQTIGRAARNLNGRAILYADRMTGSMERAIGETEWRRDKQIAFNEEMASPQSVFHDVADILEGAAVPGARSKKRKGMAQAAEESARYENELRSPSEITKRIRQLEEKCMPGARSRI